MVIGVIGAGLSGLVAAKKLALAGHEVTVIERSRSLGGKLATHFKDDMPLDYGCSYLRANGSEFAGFLQELEDKQILQRQNGRFAYYDGSSLFDLNPNESNFSYWTGKKGINSVGTQLSRWVDVKSDEKAGGITYIGSDRRAKRAWMINLTDISVFECDAVIIATPAPDAYGVLQTAQDETPARRIIRYIDEVYYNPCISLMATFDRQAPAWNGVDARGEYVRWISNESAKIEHSSKTGVVIQSTPEFARNYANGDPEEIKRLLLERAADITDSAWLKQPEWTNLHLWKYFDAVNPLDEYFLELEMDEAPLALIGDYMRGNSMEDAFLSGYYLAEYWINKYSEVTV